MKLALIPPIKQIWYAEMCQVHLILSHLIDNTLPGRQYRKFYTRLNPGEHYKILDNGAHEQDQGDTLANTLRRAVLLGGVHEIVVPDAQQDGSATVKLAEEAANFLATNEGQVLYEKAGKPRLMWVPQGRTFEEWLSCLDALMFAHDVLATNEHAHDRPVIGIAKKHARYFPFVEALQHCAPRGLAMHILGWPDSEAVEASAYFGARSIDTAKPFIYTMQEIDVSITKPVPPASRPQDYFYVDWDMDKTLLKRNLEFYIQGVDSLPVRNEVIA